MTPVTASVIRSQQIVRPLPELIPLIHAALDAGDKAALEHYRAAGDMLIEAKSQLARGEFTSWVKQHFQLSPESARRYMQLAAASVGTNGSALPFRSLSDFIRHTSNPSYNRRAPRRDPEPVTSEPIEGDRLEQEPERLCQQQLWRELALDVIDTGYRVIAKRLHPDREGSHDEMARLNDVRDRLKELAKSE